MTPWLVIHHSSSREIKLKYFPLLFEPWTFQHITDSRFDLYLRRMLTYFNYEVNELNLEELIKLSQNELIRIESA